MSDLEAIPEDIRHAYRLLLGREPDEQGYANHLRRLKEAPQTAISLAKGFFGSPEFIARFGCLIQVPSGDFPPPSMTMLHSQACTQRQIESPAFLYWAQRLRERPAGLHRKLWEWCFITQGLYERGFLRPGAKGLGFAVGTEQLTALFASMGCEILATDLEAGLAEAAGWVDTNQHAAGLDQLNTKGLCPPSDFARRVSFLSVDMRNMPRQLQGFDFLWSSCALEHLGSLQLGLDFVVNAMDSLRPGGVAIHTTELNCDSETETIETGGSVIYRKSDLLGLAERLKQLGYSVEPLDFYTGETEADRYVDEFPYGGKAHIKLRIGPYASTSFGFIVTKAAEAAVTQ